jgi:hypothetical protein
MKISTILEKIDENQLFVPAFQREYVWKRDDAKQLVDSLIKEYPTGTMLTWETANPPELKGPHKYNEKQGAVKLLLDGQQRVTTLYMLINGVIPPYYTAPEIMNDTRGLYVNVETLELNYYMKTRMENNPSWQNITDVFKSKISAFDLQAKYAGAGRALGMEELKKLNDNINSITRIKEREFPEQTIPVKATIREAIDIFYKVNASGVALTEAELALAQISGYWPQARDRFKAKLAALEKEGFVFKLDFVVYVLLGCLYHMGSDMRKLHLAENDEKIRAAWDRLDNQVLDYVVNLLRANAFIDHTDEINSPYALVPIIVYCFDKNGAHLTDAEIRKMVKWFFYSQVRTRYVSQLPQKLDRDLRTVAESPQPFDEMLQVIRDESQGLEIQPAEFVGRAVQHPLFSMVRWYLKSRGAVCLTTGMSLRKNMGSKYKLERDHIFPYSKLKEVGYGEANRVKYALAQELTNRAILTQVENRTKSAAHAADYLASAKAKFPKALELQCIPEDPELWKIENYEQFLEERRRILAKHLNAFLDKITATEETVAPVSLEEMIAEGESDELEFKSTLRWSLNEGIVDKKLEDVILKTVAAFANSAGGTLLIGVDDSGEVLGLEQDYASLSADRDKFELHLRNLLNQQFGTGFVTSRVQIKFYSIADKEVCQIETSAAKEPVITSFKDKNGITIEKFYARSGNSSQEIPMSEMNDYIKGRFHS